jgi:acyl-CoA thioesterase
MSPLTEARGDEIILDPTWWSWSGAHGGVLVAEAVRHAAATLGVGPRRSLRSVSVQLLSAVGAAPVRLRPTLLREGGTATSVALAAEQGGELRLHGHAVFGADGSAAAPGVAPAGAPRVDPPETSPVVRNDPTLVPFTQHVEFRSADGSRPLAGAADAQLTAWIRLREQATVDGAAAVMLLDALAPALYASLRSPVPVPTLDYTVHIVAPLDVRPVPAGSWLLARQRCVSAADGWAVDDGTLWDAGGRLLATARQTRRVL